ncbi:hypothetical protein EVAR_79907_1 [Eumeta japonica]|uniref:Uncharacterized protein n=1 Tax=Eumeta variegata TaxID=151549 RepID=A0A4C1TZ76_EUMVA|nr:hypothetical protein EVAR_79907_1 [Eumeta japonica]
MSQVHEILYEQTFSGQEALNLVNIPHNLIEAQKLCPVNWCRNIMQRFAGGDANALYDIDTEYDAAANDRCKVTSVFDLLTDRADENGRSMTSDAGHKLFQSHHVQEVVEIRDSGGGFIHGKVTPQTRVNNRPYDVKVETNEAFAAAHPSGIGASASSGICEPLETRAYVKDRWEVGSEKAKCQPDSCTDDSVPAYDIFILKNKCDFFQSVWDP